MQRFSGTSITKGFATRASSFLKGLASVSDLFSRTTSSTSLGQAGSGTWQNIRGSWGIVGNVAVNADAANTYPLSTLTFTKTDVTIGVSGVGYGVGSAFWVTDSGNWWGTYSDGVYSCQTCYNTSNCASYASTYTPGNIYAYYYASLEYPRSGCPAGTNAANCASCECYTPSYRCCLKSVPAYNPGTYYTYCATYNTSNPYSCNCSTAYYIRLIKYISNALTLVASFSFASAIASFKTIINSSTGSITIQAYQGANYATQIGSNQSTTVSGFTASKKHGILKAPSDGSVSQGNSLNRIDVS